MYMMYMEQIIKSYFDAFCAKNLSKLSELYSDDIVLSEWGENVFVGKQAVLEANNNLFSKFTNISIEILSCGEDDLLPVSLNEILVKLDDEQVKVVDVITIIDNKITKINAYRGF